MFQTKSYNNASYRKAAKKIEEALLSGETTLNLSSGCGMSTKLTVLPDSLIQLTHLKSLDLNNNQLIELPTWIEKLTQLESLDLSDNQLMDLPDSIGQLTRLEKLYLQDNQLSYLPKSLVKSSQLQSLYLHNNQLTSLPEWLGQLTHLQELTLDNNKLVNLPESLGQLADLRLLALQSARLVALPDWIRQLTHLEALYLNNNQLTELPYWLGQLTHLESIYINNNPLSAEILRLREEGQLIPYLRDLAEARQQSGAIQPYPFDEAKLLLVGSGEVGKTWLLQALQGKKPQPSSSTKGIEIAREPLDVPHPTQGGRTIHLNCWDFGGQEHYQITHQIFFGPKAIYLLAWKPRPVMDHDLMARLERIQLSVGQTAKVFIVSTHANDNVPAMLGEKALKERFGDLIQGFYQVDSAEGPDGTGIAVLKADIARAAAQLEGMNTDFPDEWHEAQKAVREAEKPSIPFREFAEICTKKGMKPESCESLAIIMDELGNAVFFGDAPQSGEAGVGIEENLIVLDPEWLAKAVTFVIEDEDTRKNSGVLTHTHLREVWKKDAQRDCPGYNRKLFGYLLWMMWKFDIAYKQNQQTSLVPELIHRNRPDDLRWHPIIPRHEERQATLICHIPQDPPIGLIPALTAAVHPLRRIQNLEQIVDGGLDRNWRDGFFLDTERRGTAFVELLDRDLHIVVRDSYPRDLCDQIRKTLNRIKDDRWPRLDLDYRVPCIGRVRGDEPCPGAFKWKYLDGRRGERVSCQDCDSDEIEVNKMLEGFDARHEETIRALGRLKAGQADLMVVALRIYRDSLDPERTELERGPCMFTILPNELGGWNVLAKATEKRVRVTCWCEHPDEPHVPLFANGKPSAEYVLTAPHDWLVKIAPYISWAAMLLKAFVPLAGAVTKVDLGEALPSDLKTQIDLMGDASKALPTGKLEPGRRDALASVRGQRPEIIALRHIHDALLAQVSEQKRWGDLRLVRTKSGDLLWLCAEHAARQQPPVQEI